MKQVRVETGIVHFRVEHAQTLREFLLKADLEPLALEPDAALVDRWFYFGCIYVDGLRQRQDVELNPGQILRLHTRSKSYVANGVDLKSRIVLDETEFLVLDKPAGLPTHATLDNFVENASFILSEELGQKIYVTHRLDIATEGLLILGKTPAAQALLNKGFAKGRVEKFYRALTHDRLPPGLHTHYMNPEGRGPKEVSGEANEGWWTCQLEIQESKPHRLGFRHKIRLITGKTHQIRAQLAALGEPIHGDQLYGSTTPFTTAGIALESYQLDFQFRERKYSVKRRAGSLS